jgi:undecaprenyl diphosphate synthase
MSDSSDHSGLDTGQPPAHVAIIMDGNGRWAKQRGLPRYIGHRSGVISVRQSVEAAIESGVDVLSLFAFSRENWQRPEIEVSQLMRLFNFALKREVRKLHKNGVRLRVIGERSAFSPRLVSSIEHAEALTQKNTRLQLVIAANYGGQWDILEGVKQIAEQVSKGEVSVGELDDTLLASKLVIPDIPNPDLFIRTGGEQRISNFFLWQLAYTELYFTDCLWPDFRKENFHLAIEWFKGRQRRFGRTGEQVTGGNDA